MSRLSFNEFSAGLPVQRQSLPTQETRNKGAEEAGFLSSLNPFGKANRDRLKDIPSDLMEGFDGAVDSVSSIFGRNQDIRDRVTRGETTPLEGTGEVIGGGLKAGAGVVGSALITAGKLFTTPEQEEKVKAFITSATEAVAGTRPIQEIKAQYDAMSPQEQRNIDSFIGAAEGLGTMFGAKPVFDVLRKTLGKVGDATATTIRNGASAVDESISTFRANRTAQQAAEEVVRAANPTPALVSNPVMDTIRGAGQQVADFAKRTVNEAQDTAVESRRLAEMPEQKSSLIRKGADERIVNVMEKATPEEIKVYSELIEQAKAKEIDPTPNTPQPKNIAGREFLKPVQYVIDERKVVGKKLGEYRKNLDTKKNVDTNPAFRAFHTYLKDTYKVQFDKNGKIIADTGSLASSDLKSVQKIYDQLKSNKKNSQTELDQWLQRTYKDYDLVQAREKTFSEDVPRIAEYARSQVRTLMPEDYNKLATEYAQMSKPLNDFVKLMGYKGNLDDLTAKELKAGEIALRVLGNAADRPQSVIDGILDTATARGYQSTIDLNRLIYITDQLEDLYDITPSRGFSGSATRGINQSDAAGVIGDAATMNLGGLFNRAMGSRASQKEIQAAFEEYVKYLNEGGTAPAKPGSFKPGETPKQTTQTVEPIDEMITKAPEAKSFIDGIADDVVAGIPEAKVAKAPIKSRDRAIEKIMNEEAGDFTKLRDLARNSIVPMNPEALTASIAKMDEVLAKAKADGLYARKKVQTPEKFSGYGGTIYNIETPNGLIAEIQVVEPRMIFGKMLPEDAEAILGKDLFDSIQKETGMEPGYGHKLYEQLRDLSIEDLEGDAGKKLIQESVDYYNKLR